MSVVYFGFLTFEIILFNVGFGRKSAWNNCRHLKLTCYRHLIWWIWHTSYDKDKCHTYTDNFPQINSIPENITKHCQREGGIALPYISTFYFITFISKLSLSGEQGLGVCPRQATLSLFFLWFNRTFTPTYTPCCICLSKTVLENYEFIKM